MNEADVRPGWGVTAEDLRSSVRASVRRLLVAYFVVNAITVALVVLIAR